MSKRRQQRAQQTQNFYKSLQLLQAGKMLCDEVDENTPFEDYSIYMYRQNAPEFKSRVKDLEKKLLFPVRETILCARDNDLLCSMECCVLTTSHPKTKQQKRLYDSSLSLFFNHSRPNNLASIQILQINCNSLLKKIIKLSFHHHRLNVNFIYFLFHYYAPPFCEKSTFY